MKKLLLLLIPALLLLGCVQAPAPTPTPTAVPTATATLIPSPTATPTATPIPFQPITLDYSLKGINGPQGSETTVTLWLTEEKDCAGKTAMLGFMRSVQPGETEDRSRWNKITVYETDGAAAYSRGISKNELSFGDAKSEAEEFDFLLTLNFIFAAAGENFNTADVWNKTAPTVLNNVSFGTGTVTDVSITKTGERTNYALPCTEFTIVTKSGGPGEIKACVAKKDSLPQPFIVNFAIGDQMSVTLKTKSSESPTTPYYAQCMDLIKCKLVTPPTNAENQACQANNSQYESTRDENNCVTAYECKTLREIVRSQMEGNQRPGCPLPDNLLNQAVQCRENHQNWNTVSGQDGCITEISCQ